MSFLMWFNTFDFSKNFAFGFGVGLGVGVVVRKIVQEQRKQKDQLITCIKQLASEVKQLRSSLIKSIVSSKENDVEKNELLSNKEEEDTDEEEFFDTSKEAEVRDDTDLAAFLNEIDKLQDGTFTEKRNAFDLLKHKQQIIPNQCELLWRYAKAHIQMSSQKEIESDIEGHKDFILKGIEVGQQAIEADSANFNAHKWYAMLIGSSITYLDNKGKITTGYKYKDHIETAIKLNPSDAVTHNLLGRYFYEVYMLPWYLRKVATALFAEPPTATAEDALNCFLKAEELKPGFWAENCLYIGKCYYQMSDYADAKRWFQKTLDLVDDTSENSKVKEEATTMMKKC